jgi:hypothetical protein
MITIAGYLLMVAIAMSVLAQSPTVTVIIGTVTGIVLGVPMQSLIGNAVAGPLALTDRPFRIGDKIAVFCNSGEVYDVGLLYTTLITQDGDTVLLRMPPFLPRQLSAREGNSDKIQRTPRIIRRLADLKRPFAIASATSLLFAGHPARYS